jgi:hypothetical protein
MNAHPLNVYNPIQAYEKALSIKVQEGCDIGKLIMHESKSETKIYVDVRLNPLNTSPAFARFSTSDILSLSRSPCKRHEMKRIFLRMLGEIAEFD